MLDTALGRPAAGVQITLAQRVDGAWSTIATATTDMDGRVREFGGVSLHPGQYQISFDVAAYLRATGREAPFLQRVTIEFAMQSGHYHVPLLASPFSGTTYRGS